MESIIGKKYGKLTVISESDRRDKSRCILFECRCECGNTTYVRSTTLRAEPIAISCKKCINLISGLSNTLLGKRHQYMMTRCYNKNNSSYQNYGGRGIKVCKEWHDVRNFIKDMENGFKPSLSLERMNNDDDYHPDNCRWATKKEQNENRSSNKAFIATSPDNIKYESNNQTKFALEHGLSRKQITACLSGKNKSHKGWKFERA